MKPSKLAINFPWLSSYDQHVPQTKPKSKGTFHPIPIDILIVKWDGNVVMFVCVVDPCFGLCVEFIVLPM